MTMSQISAPVTISRPQTAADLQAAVQGAAAITAAQQRGVGQLVSLAGSLTAPVDLWVSGKAAFGNGEAGAVLKGLGGVHVAVGTYKAVRGFATKVTPEVINEALKPQNGGKDLDPADAEMLASKINQRARITSSVALGNYIASGAAIATGNMAAGIVALALKVASVGTNVATAAQTVKDIQDVLKPTQP